MPSRTVDVFDNAGAKLFSYSIAIEEDGCLDAEFEEVALIFAESSGLVAAEEIAHLRACCDIFPAAPIDEITEPARPKRQKSAIVSLVKHRMKRTGIVAERRRAQRIS